MMPDDTDFDVTASDISDRVIVIRDPQLVLTIEKWLVRLTADENRSRNELDYLKLLQYMVVNKRIGPPFHQNPPTGPLLPLSRFLLYSQQLACDGPPVWCRNRTKCCRLVSKSGDRTELRPEHEQADDENDFEEQNVKGGAASDIAKYNCKSGNQKDFEKINAPVLSIDDETKTHCKNEIAVSDEKSMCPANDHGDAILMYKRDGLHLAGGGGGECGPCSGGAHTSKPKINPNKLCDPCLDLMGRHLKKPQPKPIDMAYRDLLGDCAFPVFTETEQKTVNPRLLLVLKSVNDQTTLQDFYFQVPTCIN